MGLIAAMMLVLIFLGLFVEQVSMMLITLPIFMPLVQKFGVDPVWFGVDVPDLHAASGCCCRARPAADDHEGRRAASGDHGHIFRAVIPYIAMSLLVLALVFLCPGSRRGVACLRC